MTEMKFCYFGKVKDLTFKELYLCFYYGRKIEQLEATDFCWS